jgi:uncharacterized protein
LVLVAAATFAGAAMQSATGFGFALVLSPALFATLDPYEAVSVLLALGLVLGLLMLADTGLDAVRWREIWPPLGAALPGLGLGVIVLRLASKPVLQVAVGAAVLAAVAWQARRRAIETRAGKARPPADGKRRVGALAGLASGALTTSISLSGPPLVLWLEARRLRPVELRASLAVCFLALNLSGLALLLASDGGDSAKVSLLLPLLGVVLAGHLAGVLLSRQIDPRRFSAVVLAVAAATALVSVGSGLSAA